tara:strand:+ start:56 stop:490 length:435 start_codon:yes stop_codon:yes gene_type:complete
MDKINRYIATLNIDIETYQWNEQFLNQFAKPDAKLKSVSIPCIRKFVDDEIEDLTADELNEICYEGSEITFVVEESEFHKGFSKTFINEVGFTVRQMFDNVVDFEIKARPLSNWFGGIDCHHIYFDGFNKIDGTDNHYTIYWGS